MGIRLSGNKLRLRSASRIAISSIIGNAATALVLTDMSSGNPLYQRVGTSKTITVSGTYSGTPDAIQARAVPVGTAVSNTGYAWTTIATLPTGGTYSGSLAVAQGSNYILQVKDSVNASINAVGVNKFEVGMIVALLGQSNMANFKNTTYQYPLAAQNTKVLSAGAWVFGGNHDDTLAYPANTISSTYGATYTTGVEQGDGEVYLANYLASTVGCPVRIINKAVGGTNISSWQPSGGANYAAFITALNAVGGDCEAVFWYQGEDDAALTTTSASYQTSLGNILAELKTQTGRSASTFKFGVVTLGTTTAYATEGRFGVIRSAQLDFVAANTSNGAFYAATACDAGTTDGVHLGGVAHARLGKRYAGALLKELGLASYGMTGPTITSAARVGAVVTVTIAQDGGTALQDGGGGSGSALLGFRVYDGGTITTISTTSISGNTVVLTLSATPAGVVTMDYAMANAPFTTTVSASSIVYDNATVSGDTLGRTLRPKALFTVT